MLCTVHHPEYPADIARVMLNRQMHRAIQRHGDRMDDNNLAKAICEAYRHWSNNGYDLVILKAGSPIHPPMPMSPQERHHFLVELIGRHREHRVSHFPSSANALSQMNPLSAEHSLSNQPFRPIPQPQEEGNGRSRVTETGSESPPMFYGVFEEDSTVL